jgi:hypothetical protein
MMGFDVADFYVVPSDNKRKVSAFSSILGCYPENFI